MQILRLESVDSTNTWVAGHENELESPALVYTLHQSKGRGQRGNSWESEPGKNITATVLFHPLEFPAISQFVISEALSLAIIGFLKRKGVEAKVKWPNDIYVGDKKICGILVEHMVTGKNITRTIAGFGINLNQTEFYSDAPNPVSLKMITGQTYSLEEAIEEIANIINHFLRKLDRFEEIHEEFLKLLWRADDRLYKFYDHKNHEPLTAKIKDVGPDGILTLQTSTNEIRQYMFKEVEFLLK